MAEENKKDEQSSSILAEIIKENHSEPSNTNIVAETGNTPPISTPTNNQDNPKPPKQPIPPGTIFKAIGALFFAWVIFFASFLAYIVFNPGDAQFFVTMFGIDTKDVENILRKFINGSFGIIIFFLSIVWIIQLFRAIWTPTEQKRRKTLAWILAIVIGIILFSVLAFWAFLFQKIGQIVWDGWKISIYDNDLYSQTDTQHLSELNNTKNLIWPITLRFDITSNAKSLEANGNMLIDEYSINFDGAACNNNSDIITGKNPKWDQSIICTFNEIKSYNIQGTYKWKDFQWEEKTVDIKISPVDIVGVMDIKKEKNIADEDILIFDAKKLKLLGDITWTFKDGKTSSENVITITPKEEPTILGLNIWNNIQPRIFPIQKDAKKKGVLWDIEVIQSNIQPLEYTFTLTGVTTELSQIIKIDWLIKDATVICTNKKQTCTYTFWEYWRNEIRAIIHIADGSEISLKKEISVVEPLRLLEHARVNKPDGTSYNLNNLYDPTRRSYIIEDLSPPERLIFDARDVTLENPGFTIKEVRWELSDGRNTTQKVGDKVQFDINTNARYEIQGIYTFEKRAIGLPVETQVAKDTFVVNTERSNLIPILNIVKQTSDYVPVSITLDGSQSKSENNEIVKFIYNFGEGRPDVEWDAIQTYEYKTAWEKAITLTIIDSEWQKAQTKKVIILKDAPKTLNMTSSINPWMINTPIDFSVKNENGQVDEYSWTFSDNTPIQRWPSVTHTFSKIWSYTVTLTANYSDGTQKQTSSQFTVTNAIE